jgi:nitroreductase
VTSVPLRAPISDRHRLLSGIAGPGADGEDGWMELIDVLRSTGSVREFTDQPVDDDTLARVLDTARFAPSGGNAQSWRVVVVQDRHRREQLRDLYLRGWYDYLAMARAGLRPWAPTNDPAAEYSAVAAAPDIAAESAAHPGFAEQLDQAPVVLALFADLSLLAAVDRDFDRYGLVGGASVYPFAWSILLAAREEGLGGVITTMATHEEDRSRRSSGRGTRWPWPRSSHSGTRSASRADCAAERWAASPRWTASTACLSGRRRPGIRVARSARATRLNSHR